MAKNKKPPRHLSLDKDNHEPLTLRSPYIAQYIAAMSAEWQEAFEVEMAQRNETYLWPDPPNESPTAEPSNIDQIPLTHPQAEYTHTGIGDLGQGPYEEVSDSGLLSEFNKAKNDPLPDSPVEMTPEFNKPKNDRFFDSPAAMTRSMPMSQEEGTDAMLSSSLSRNEKNWDPSMALRPTKKPIMNRKLSSSSASSKWTSSHTAVRDSDVGAPEPAKRESAADFRARDSEEREAKVNKTPVLATGDPRVPMDSALTIMLSKVLRDPKGRKALQELKGDRVQLLVDFMHSVFLRSKLPEPWLQKYALFVLYKLCRESTLYPRRYVLRDVTHDSTPVNSRGFCDTYKGHYKKRSICLKVMHVSQDTGNMLKTIAEEAIFWGQLYHTNILPFYGIYYLDENRKQICLVSPWVDNGNVHEFLNRNPLAPRKPLIYDIARGLEYLHEQSVVHGDLKGANVLVNNSGQACIADVGLAFAFTDKDLVSTTATRAFRRNCRWCSPELLEGDARPSSASDVWAFGSVCFEVLTGQLPYYERKTDPQVIRAIIEGKLPARPETPGTQLGGIDDEMWRLMSLCWAREPKDRPTSKRILRELKLEVLLTESEGGALEEIRQESQDFRDAMETPDTAIDLLQVEKILNEL